MIPPARRRSGSPRMAALPLLPFLTALAVLPRSGVAAETETQAAGGPRADSSAFDLSAYQGKVVYLDFWASWCAPCKRSFPWMRQMQERHGREGFEVVAVDLDRDRKAAAEFLARSEVTFRIIRDPKGRMAEAYRIETMPSSFIYDRAGRQRAAHLGFRESDEDALEAQITSLLTESLPDSTPR